MAAGEVVEPPPARPGHGSESAHDAVRAGPFANGTALGLRYYGFRAGAWLAERLPMPVTDVAADLAGRAAYRASVRKREVVARNMTRVGGPGADVPRLVKEAYRSYAHYWLETFRLGRYRPEDVLAMVDVVGAEVVDRALASGTGLLVVLPHFGYWDLLGAWAGARHYPLTTVAEVLKPRVLFEWFAGIREATGMTILPAKPGTQALRNLLKALQNGEVAALVADRDLGRKGIWVEYLGEATTAPVGPALLAARTGAPLASVGFYQVGKGRRARYRCEITEVPYQRTGDEHADIDAIAQVIATALGEVVRKAPAQYHLFSTNWPADEPGLPPRGRRPQPEGAPEAAPGAEAPSPEAAPGAGAPSPEPGAPSP